MVILRPQAQNSIKGLYQYLCEIDYPETAKRFTQKLRNFIVSLDNMPERYPVCRFELFASLQLRCASFKGWVIVYKITDTAVIILNVIHGSRLKD